MQMIQARDNNKIAHKNRIETAIKHLSKLTYIHFNESIISSLMKYKQKDKIKEAKKTTKKTIQ